MEDKNSNVSSFSVATKCPYYPRINHRALLLGEEALIFGGSSPNQEPLQTILRFNFENSRIDPVFEANCPSIEGFSLFSTPSSVYLWGGFLHNKPSNALHFFNGTRLEEIEQKGSVPEARGFHCSAWVASRYLLIYGGYNENNIFNDWYILDTLTSSWNKMKPNLILPKNTVFQLGWKNGRGFLVSSEWTTTQGNTRVVRPKNQIYEVRITNFNTFQLRIDPLLINGSDLPPPRANPTLVFTEKAIFMLGGEGLSTKSKGLYSDIWCFDVESLSWSLVLQNSLAKFGAMPIVYQNSIYLFGGLRSMEEMSGSVDIITFRKKKSINTQVCTFCRNIYGLNEKARDHIGRPQHTLEVAVKENWDPTVSISTSFLSKMAHTLQNPLQAFGLLIDNSLNMSASTIHISIEETSQPEQYFSQRPTYILLGDNSRSFFSEELIKMMFSFRYRMEKSSADEAYEEELKIRSEYGLNLKMASLRLGKSCLFVSKTLDGPLFVSYFSELSSRCPDGEPTFNCLYYTIDREGVASSRLDKQIICENVAHFLSESEFTQMERFNTKIYIEGLYDIRKGDGDISFGSSGLSLNFTSLADYISKLYLSPVPGREIRVEGKKVNCADVGARFRQQRASGQIQEMERGETNLFNKCGLYQCEGQGRVYIYHQNRLITAIHSQGRSICGFIEIPDLVEVDFFKARLEKYHDQKRLESYIQEKESGKKRLREIDPSNSYGKVRKMKPACVDI